MHPRNIYKDPPDFSKLAIKYPEFLKITSIDLNGTVRIDFKNANSVRVLTKCLLHSDFNLNVDIPSDRLVPTVPLRLNYLLWLEDILKDADRKENIHGIDIGTGASCIYPLLAAKKFNWKMMATEVDEKSLSVALKNVSQNNLEHLITIIKSQLESDLLTNCFTTNGVSLESVDFCMCNPPFFSSTDDIDCARNPLRAPPRNARTGSLHEIITPGGEEYFVEKIIQESLILRDKVRIYTTMLGHKSSLKPLIGVIKGHGITQVTHTTFRQGKTTRWGLAWSFLDNSNLCSQAVPKKQKMNKPMSFAIPPINGLDYNVREITLKVLEILKVIDLKSKIVQKSENLTTIEIKATRNTWSHQRRKRRETKNMSSESVEINHVSETIKNCVNKAEESNHLNCKNISSKRSISLAGDCDTSAKLPKLDNVTETDRTLSEKTDNIKSNVDKINNNSFNEKVNGVNKGNECHLANDSASLVNKVEDFLVAAIGIRKHDDMILFEVAYISGEGGKDSVHQIVQYIKNNWM